jgi:hypothetical protein
MLLAALPWAGEPRAGSAVASQDAPDVEVRLREPGGTASSRLSAIEAIGRIAATQPAAQGLRMTLGMTNTGAVPLSILDPAELSQPQVLTTEGWPVELPRKLPSWRKPGGERQRPPVVVVAPGGEHRFEIVVPRILATQPYLKLASGAPGGGSVLIPAGSYQVKLRLVLGSAEADATGRRETRILESEPVRVALTP